MQVFDEWVDARQHAISRLNKTGLDQAIRMVREFGKVRYVVSFASKNDSDYTRAEIVRSSDYI